MYRRLYRILLRLYPPEVRRRFGRDMIECFDDMLDHAPRHRRAVVAGKMLLELPRSAIRSRWGSRRVAIRPHPTSSRGITMDTVWQDVRYAARGLRRQPGLSVLAVLSLGLGIGANTSMVSSVNAIIWNQLAVEEPDRLVRVHEYQDRFTNFSYANYLDVRQSVAAIEDLAVHTLNPFAVFNDGASEIVYGELVSANYFEMLRVRAAHGRVFGTADGALAEPVVVLSHTLWERAFGARADIVGRTVRVNGHVMTILGVAPESFVGTKFGLGMDLWVPIEGWARLEGWTNWRDARGSRWLETIGRLAPGATMESAQAELHAVAAALAAEHPRTNRDRTFRVTEDGLPAPDAQGLPQLIGVLAITASAMVLLVACANVASLLMARGVTRRREMAIRRAVGASRGRIARQLLTESLMLAGLGGVLGVTLAFGTSDFIWWFIPPLPYRFAIDAAPDAGVLLIATGVTLATAFVFGLAPALHASRTDAAPAVRGDGASGAVDGKTNLRLRVVVTGMMALAFVTLLLTGLFTRSLAHVRSLDPGFAASGRLLATMDGSLAGYDGTQALEYFQSVLERVRAIPGVQAAAIGEILPLGDRSSSSALFAADRGYEEGDQGIQAIANRVSPEYFATMDIPIKRGRSLAETDRADRPPVIVINETLAARLWPDGVAVGRRLRFSATGGDPLEIVGVVADGRYVSISEPQRPAYYVPLAQAQRRSAELIVQTAAEPSDIVSAVRSATRAIDPLVPVFNFRTMSDHLAGALWMFRLGAGLGAALGGLALALAAAGLYGVMAFAVTQRRNELGLRIALGARANQVVGLVLRQAGWMAGLGIAFGSVAALALAGPLGAALVGIQPRDPVTFAVVIVILLAVTLVASVAPARHAVRADPVRSLRSDA